MGKRDLREDIEMLAESAFKKHTLVWEEKTRTWYCGEPGTGIYHFRVAELPGCIAVWGDIGNMMILGRGYGLEWAAGSIHSTDYFLSKTNKQKDQYYASLFKEHLIYHLDEYDRNRKDEDGEVDDYYEKKYQDQLSICAKASVTDYDEMAYNDYMSEHYDCEVSFHYYDSEAFWFIEALKVFFRLYEQQKTNDAPTEDLAGAVSGGVAGA